MKNKKVWIINQYAGAFSDVTTGRHFNFARELVLLGYDVVLVMAARSHLSVVSDLGSEHVATDFCNGVRLVYVNVPAYSGASSFKRVLSWFCFSARLRKVSKIIKSKPDVVYYSSLSLIGFLGAERLSKKFNAPIIFEVRDIWPLTLIELGGISRRHPFVIFLQWIEDRAYRKSAFCFSNLENLPEHIKARVGEGRRFAWLPNGVNEYDGSSLSDYDLHFPEKHFVVGYTGSIGTANAMSTLIEAAKLLKYDDISFVIAGDGEQLSFLREYVENNQLVNVHILGRIPRGDVPSLIKRFDACYIGWSDNPLYRYGIGANKIPEYLYSGKPILHSYSGGADPVAKYGAGVTVAAEDPTALACAIQSLRDMPESHRRSMGDNGRAAAVKDYLFPVIASKIDVVLKRLLSD